MTLSKTDARRLILSGHRELFQPVSGRSGVRDLLRRLGYSQIDTIHLFLRAHHHVLWSRTTDYHPEWLQELQRDTRELLEYWTHAAAIVPMEHFRFCLPRMRRIRAEGRFWFEENPKVTETVLKAVTEEGPKKARDFKDSKHRGTWWDWKPAKIALQYLQMSGTLSVSHREGFEKVYELTDRVVPGSVDRSYPTDSEMADHLILTRLRSERLLKRKHFSYQRKDGVGAVSARLAELVDEGVVAQVDVEGDGPWFTLSEYLDGERLQPPAVVRILTPFDNLVILRDRLEQVFDFPFTLECYVPAAKRSFGYFAHPVLYRDEVVGQIDFKVDGTDVTVRNLELSRRAGLAEAFRREWKRICNTRGVNKITRAADFGRHNALFS
jgi:uncharacterized protein YcaQ